jgi:hypothetical protein
VGRELRIEYSTAGYVVARANAVFSMNAGFLNMSGCDLPRCYEIAYFTGYLKTFNPGWLQKL